MANYQLSWVSNKIFKDSDLQSDLREDLKLVPSTQSQQRFKDPS